MYICIMDYRSDTVHLLCKVNNVHVPYTHSTVHSYIYIYYNVNTISSTVDHESTTVIP